MMIADGPVKILEALIKRLSEVEPFFNCFYELID